MELEKAKTFFNATLLSQFGLFASFLNALAETDGVFGGSIILQAVLEEVYIDSDIDIFFPSTDYKSFMHGVLIAHNYSRIHTSNGEYSALNSHIVVSYKQNNFGKKVQLIFYDGVLALHADIAAASFIYNSRDEQFDLHGHSIELLRKRITYMFPNVNCSVERFNKYKERGFIILKDKPIVLDCCKLAAPLLHNEYEYTQEVVMSHHGRYFNLN
jgi:hypothetical protein